MFIFRIKIPSEKYYIIIFNPPIVFCLCFGLAGLSLTTLAESIAETPTHQLQVATTAGASSLPSLGLFGPVICLNERKKRRYSDYMY